MNVLERKSKMIEKIECVIELPPRTKKNSQRILKAGNRMFIAPSAQYKQYEKDCAWWLNRFRDTNIDFPVNVKCLFYMPTKRKCDLTNLLEAIDDILVHYNVLADDNFSIIQSHDGSRVFVDKQNPRTEILIEKA